jgi:uncharacterized paraquat-inducible protein A
MTQHLSLRCPACNAKLRAPFALIGRVCPCPRCKYRVEVRPRVPSDADVALVTDDEPPTLPPAPAARR